MEGQLASLLLSFLVLSYKTALSQPHVYFLLGKANKLVPKHEGQERAAPGYVSAGYLSKEKRKD